MGRVIYDLWTGEPVHQDPPFTGRAALLVGLVATVGGAVVMAGAITLVHHLFRRVVTG